MIFFTILFEIHRVPADCQHKTKWLRINVLNGVRDYQIKSWTPGDENYILLPISCLLDDPVLILVGNAIFIEILPQDVSLLEPQNFKYSRIRTCHGVIMADTKFLFTKVTKKHKYLQNERRFRKTEYTGM